MALQSTKGWWDRGSDESVAARTRGQRGTSQTDVLKRSEEKKKSDDQKGKEGGKKRFNSFPRVKARRI